MTENTNVKNAAGNASAPRTGCAFDLAEVNGETCVKKCPVFTTRHAQKIHDWRQRMECTLSRCAELAEEAFGQPWCEAVLHYTTKEMKMVHTLGYRLVSLGIACLDDDEWYQDECDWGI